MAKIMEMPKLSDTMKEGGIARWLAKEGDKVTTGVPVVEIETDKATMEYESPAGGVLLKILVPNGTAALNAPIAVIGKPGEDWQEALKAYQEKSSKQTHVAIKGGMAPDKSVTSAGPAPSTPHSGADASASKQRIIASPLARRMARERNLDLGTVSGSGPNGRIVMRDLAKVPPPIAAPLAKVTGTESERIPLTMMRKTIAARLTQSVHEAPQFHLTVSVNIGPLAEWRKKALAGLSEKSKFSLNDVLIFVVSRVLLKHPEVNSSWGGDHILQHRVVHMGIAVALEQGLVTPVIRNAHLLSVPEIAAATRELVAKAREGRLQNEDYAGGTFSISNLGMFGIDEFTAILNPPQAGILAVGGAVPTPVVGVEGQITVEQRLRVTMGCDHRVIDGASGARFLNTLKMGLEDPLSLLLL